MVPPWALQKGTESRDWDGVWGRAALSCAPGRALGVQGARERFWGSSSLLPSSHLAEPRWFWHQGWSRGSGAGGLGPALALCGRCQLSHLHGGQGQVLGARSGLHCCQQDQGCSQGEGEQTPTLPLPALQHGRQELPELAASAGSLGKAGPARCASTAGVRPCPRLSAHILTPKLGCWSRLSLSCTSLAWGWLLSTPAPSWMGLTLFYSFTFCIFLHRKREQAGPCCISPPAPSSPKGLEHQECPWESDQHWQGRGRGFLHPDTGRSQRGHFPPGQGHTDPPWWQQGTGLRG